MSALDIIIVFLFSTLGSISLALICLKKLSVDNSKTIGAAFYGFVSSISGLGIIKPWPYWFIGVLSIFAYVIFQMWFINNFIKLKKGNEKN